MKRLFVSLALGLSLTLTPALAAGEVTVDGRAVEAAATVRENTTYVSLRAVVQALAPEAGIQWTGSCALAEGEDFTLTAQPGNCWLEVNGRALYVPQGVLLEEGRTLVPVRVLAQALGAALTWDGAIQISTAGAVLPVSGAEFYDADAVFLLSHIIYNESGNQPMEGRIAVGNVLLNRVAHPSFPGTLYDVVYQPGQFYPEKTGCMEKTPNAESVAAAKLCLEGAVVVPNAYWFNGVGKSCWASRNKTCVAVIGGHAFYG